MVNAILRGAAVGQRPAGCSGEEASDMSCRFESAAPGRYELGRAVRDARRFAEEVHVSGNGGLHLAIAGRGLEVAIGGANPRPQRSSWCL